MPFTWPSWAWWVLLASLVLSTPVTPLPRHCGMPRRPLPKGKRSMEQRA